MWTEKNALNVNYFATLPMLPETDVYMQCQKEALDNFKMLLNKSKGGDLPESVTSNFSEHMSKEPHEELTSKLKEFLAKQRAKHPPTPK